MLALLLSLSLFVLHVVVILDAAGALVDHEEWMLAHLGNYPGEVVLFGCFFVLFAAHLAESAARGLFLRWTRPSSSILDGLYFAATSPTTLGFGDLLLPKPWRQLGSFIAIHGALMFGCSTAFLYVVLQHIWAQHP